MGWPWHISESCPHATSRSADDGRLVTIERRAAEVKNRVTLTSRYGGGARKFLNWPSFQIMRHHCFTMFFSVKPLVFEIQNGWNLTFLEHSRLSHVKSLFNMSHTFLVNLAVVVCFCCEPPKPQHGLTRPCCNLHPKSVGRKVGCPCTAVCRNVCVDIAMEKTWVVTERNWGS